MSKQFYNRKEFLIIVGGVTTLMGMMWIVREQEKKERSSNNQTLTNNPTSPSKKELKSKKETIKTYILEQKDDKEQQTTVYFHDIFSDKDKSHNIELLKINKKPNFVMGAPTEISPTKYLSNEKAKGPTPIEKDFYMSRYPITQKQWQAIMGDKNPSTFQEKYTNTNEPGLPVETVSWDEARDFCQKLTNKTGTTYRLPEEKEWEYACRADTPNEFSFYFGKALRSELANYDISKGDAEGLKDGSQNYPGKTTAVGNYPANSFGLQDMHGNVWEWCSDSWQSNDIVNIKQENKSDNGPIASVRGGAWHSFQSRCRIFSREFMWKNVKSNRIGFRVVCEEI